jgi:hypothetical protein
MIHQGEDLGYIADQVGHSTTRLTQDLYRHVFKAARSTLCAGSMARSHRATIGQNQPKHPEQTGLPWSEQSAKTDGYERAGI